MQQTEHANIDWLILQLADSAFPAGGFAHSGGLEAAWQLGAVRNAAALVAYLDAQVLQISRTLLPFVKRVHATPDDLKAVDAECHAFLNNPVARRASIVQGQAFLMAAAKAFGDGASKHVSAMIRRRELHGHWSPAFGVLTASMNVDAPAAARLFLFISVRGIMSAAVRLGVVGPLEAQSIQFNALKRIDPLIVESEPAQTSPMLDLWQGVQDRLYSRLFQS